MKKRIVTMLMIGALSGIAYFNTGETALAKNLEAEKTVSEISYKAIETTINVDVVNGEDIAVKLDNALKEARDTATDHAPVTVKVPAGNYKLGHNLHIFSNTKLDLSEGVTLSYTSTTGNMLMSGTNGSYKGYDNYNMSEACKGYNGFKNITVLGGTWIGNKENGSGLIRLAHATNVILEDVTVSGGGSSHQIEVAAINGLKIKDCIFKDFGKSENSVDDLDKQEALQLDIPCSSNIFRGVYEDGTMMKNVEVTGCVFQNVPRGVGTHSLLNGAYHENIKINDNTFINVIEEAIVTLGYYNCEIKRNTIQNCGGGISVEFFKARMASVYTTIFDGKQVYSGSVKHDAKTVISDNNISTKYSPTCGGTHGIKVYGRNMSSAETATDKKTVPKGNYYISGVEVKNNVIITAGHGIHISGSRNCSVMNNKIIGKGYSIKDPKKDNYDGIMIERDCKSISVFSNNIQNVARNGIFVQVNSSLSKVEQNMISGCGGRGIALYDHSQVSGAIQNNKISQTSDQAIAVSMNSTVAGNIQNNELKKSKRSGIFIYNGSIVKGDIRNNLVDNMDENGVYLSGDATVKGGIISNQISNIKGKGILIFDRKNKTTVGNIKNNTLRNVVSQGINISSMQNNITVSGNKLSKVKNNVIIVQPGKSKYTVIIKDNILSGTRQASGIRVVSGNIKILGNTLSDVVNGVYITQGAKGSVYENRYSDGVKTKINISGKKKSLSPKMVKIKKISYAKKGKATIKWDKISGASGYEVQYSSDKKFSSNVKSKVAKKNAKTVTLTGLNGKKTYYVRICSYKITNGIKVYSNYCKIKKIS